MITRLTGSDRQRRLALASTEGVCYCDWYCEHDAIGFRHKGLETFYRTGSTKGIQAQHARKLARILAALDAAAKPEELGDLLGFRLHPLKGKMKGTGPCGSAAIGA